MKFGGILTLPPIKNGMFKAESHRIFGPYSFSLKFENYHFDTLKDLHLKRKSTLDQTTP